MTIAARSIRSLASRERTPAYIFHVASAALLIVLGGVGLAIERSFPIGTGAAHAAGSAHVFGIFETNGWHNVAALVDAGAALALAANPLWTRMGAFVRGWFYVAVTLAIAIWGGETFWIATNTADQVVHGGLAILAIGSGLATPKRDKAFVARPNGGESDTRT